MIALHKGQDVLNTLLRQGYIDERGIPTKKLGEHGKELEILIDHIARDK
jgi:hypothetical protein